jgi:hypothetical protein
VRDIRFGRGVKDTCIFALLLGDVLWYLFTDFSEQPVKSHPQGSSSLLYLRVFNEVSGQSIGH